MSGDSSRIVCRRCEEAIPTEVQKCPHCGESIRSTRKPLIALLVGAGMVLASLLSIGDLWFFGVIGLLVVVGSGYFLYERRQRINRASAGGVESDAELK